MNTWIGIGNLTKDPEMRYTPNGAAVTDFSIAINNGRDKETGEERDPTFVDIVAWNVLAENCAEYLRKGKKCAVTGAITIDNWTDQEGVKRRKYRIRAYSVEFLSPRQDGEDQPPARQSRPAARDNGPENNFDDLPF